MKRRRLRKTARRVVRRPASRDPVWGHSHPGTIERHLEGASGDIVRADSAMSAALPELRAGKRSRVKQNLGYLERLLRSALAHIEKANQEIGF